jgi:hypothetical protein
MVLPFFKLANRTPEHIRLRSLLFVLIHLVDSACLVPADMAVAGTFQGCQRDLKIPTP